MYTPKLRTATWGKSSFSGGNGTCVEVALADWHVGVRDSKNTELGHLTIAATRWSAFVRAIKGGTLSGAS